MYNTNFKILSMDGGIQRMHGARVAYIHGSVGKRPWAGGRELWVGGRGSWAEGQRQWVHGKQKTPSAYREHDGFIIT